MTHEILTLLLFLFPLAYSPGPGNMFFAANGARFGFGATIPANIGYHLATWIVTVAVGMGFVTVVSEVPAVFEALRWCGAAYVMRIAWLFWRAGAAAHARHARPAGFWDGALLLVLNPKGYVIMALMFTWISAAPSGADRLSLVQVTTIFTLNNLVAFLIWTLAGDRLGRLFRHPDYAARINQGFALILATVAVWMALL